METHSNDGAACQRGRNGSSGATARVHRKDPRANSCQHSSCVGRICTHGRIEGAHWIWAVRRSRQNNRHAILGGTFGAKQKRVTISPQRSGRHTDRRDSAGDSNTLRTHTTRGIANLAPLQFINEFAFESLRHSFSAQHLRGGDSSIHLAARQQLRVRSSVHHSTKIHHHNSIGGKNRT